MGCRFAAGQLQPGREGGYAQNYALSRPVEVTRPAGETDARPKQFVLAIGTPPNPNSAAAIAKAMSDAAQKSSGETISRVLTGNEATPAAIAAELEKIRSQATLADTTLIYYAGQESLDMAGHYQLAAAGGGISEQELKQKLAAIPGRILLAVDATHSAEQFDRQASMGFCASSDAVNNGGSLDVAASDFFRELLTEDYGVVVLRSIRSSSAAERKTGPVPLPKLSPKRWAGRRTRTRTAASICTSFPGMSISGSVSFPGASRLP